MKAQRLQHPRRAITQAAMPLMALTVMFGLVSANGGREGPTLARSQGITPESDAKATVRIEAVGTQTHGATGRPRIWWDHVLGLGQTATPILVAGATGAPDVCNAAIGLAGQGSTGRITWQFVITLISASRDGVRLRVHWTRTTENPGGAEARREDAREIQLRPTEHHVLDFVENSPETPSPCASLLVRVSAEPRVESVAVQATAVDVWLVEEQDGRPARSVSDRIVGRVGEDLPFQMFALEYPISDRADDEKVRLGVSGTVRLVPASDGQVDVSVSAWRKFAYGEYWARGEGRAEVHVAVGDAVALMLPVPRGGLVGGRPPEGRLLSGATERDGRVAINLAEALQGRRLALYVRVNAVR